ncbi:hypothetical protein DPPLL_28220 [Desulfofustis limnaeus]|uniref:Molybdenum carrier n=2 Tax=Desulfofustis limnaeus TaxID=2740163 RepID=A0ABM7WBY6_9BACT|nr:hypothetical protein DPPLL_28220 [Desulfofustis limnaeus]
MGADIAAIDAAIHNGFSYGGWVPKGRKTEVGSLPERYVVREMPTAGYPKRTEQNVLNSDGTIIFTHGGLSGGSELTRKLAIKHNKPWFHLDMTALSIAEACEVLNQWVKENGIATLNVAGKSASKDEKIYGVVYEVISLLLKRYPPEMES